eukprot:scaffold85666_cov26-Tisochrysis_lutea.AAC.4
MKAIPGLPRAQSGVGLEKRSSASGTSSYGRRKTYPCRHESGIQRSAQGECLGKSPTRGIPAQSHVFTCVGEWALSPA